MKAKDYFSALKTQGKINNDDFDKFIEDLKDEFEVPDGVKAVIDANFMTKERASTDKDIMRTARAEVLNGVDAHITELIKGFSTADQMSISTEKDTNKKIKMLHAVLSKKYEDLKTGMTDSEKSTEESKIAIRDLTARVEASERSKLDLIEKHERELTETKEAVVKEEKRLRIKADLRAKLNEVEYAKEYVEDPIRKQDMFDSMMNRILKHDLDYDDTGNMVVQEIVNGVAKPKFISGTNELYTVGKLLETETSRYIKKNNGEEKKKEIEKNKQVLLNTDPGKRTLRQMQQAAAQGG
jgi:hypothetical protein